MQSALAIHDRNVLITTFTNENVDQINTYLVKEIGHVPKNVTVLSWYSFLLQDGVRPYQNHLTNRGRISTIDFLSTPNKYTPKTDVDNYYLTRSDNIYRDRVSAFICECDDCSSGLIVKRLERIYATVFIDELQDFAGYDLTFLNKLFASSISVVAVGDPRQATFSTNNASKNKRFKKSHILDWIQQGKAKQVFTVDESTTCYRSNQLICDFADALYPALPKTKSMNNTVTGHDGVFSIKKNDVPNYAKTHQPIVLRYDKRTDTMNLNAINIGLTKGRTYERVLIFPTNPMKQYLATKDLSKAGDLSKLYVAVTRARYSVAFVV